MEKILVFDIGANRGQFSDKCLNYYNNLKIISVEANPTLFTLLKNKYINDNRITVLGNVVSTKEGELIDFYVSNADTISTAEKDWITKSRFSDSYRWSPPIKVESVSLDYLIKIYGNPDLIKVDVEGYELDVIKGLSSKQKEICFEWAEEQYDKINKTCEHLINIGYNQFGFIDGDDYLVKPIKYSEWKDSDFHTNINPDRKVRWGMIWVK